MTDSDAVNVLRGIESARENLLMGCGLDAAISLAAHETGAHPAQIRDYWLVALVEGQAAREWLALEPRPTGRPRGPSRALPELELDDDQLADA